MTRYSWIQDPVTHELIPRDEYYQRKEVNAPAVWSGVIEYESPVDGRLVEGRKARREDLARTNSRPWEGMEQERKEAARQKAYQEQAETREITKHVEKTLMQLPENVRRQLTRY